MDKQLFSSLFTFQWIFYSSMKFFSVKYPCKCSLVLKYNKISKFNQLWCETISVSIYASSYSILSV